MSLPGPFPLASTELSAVSAAARSAVGVKFLRPEEFGAVGDGVADDWLALQRCLCFSAGIVNAMNYDDDDTYYHTVVGVNIPQLITSGQQQINIRLTGGRTYRITRPLIIGIGCHITGEGLIGLCRIYPDGNFNCFESFGVWLGRNYPAQRAALYGQMFIDSLTLRNFSINRPYVTPPTGPPAANAYYAYPDYGVPMARTSGGLVGTTTVVASCAFGPALPYGEFIRFSGGSETYQIVNSEPASAGHYTVTVTPAFTRAIATAEYLLLASPAQNGIMIEGGEDSLIDQIYVNNLSGAGIYIYGGQPGPIIRNCMVNACYVGYWIETGSVILEKPSGDANVIGIRCGMRRACGAQINSFKLEDPTSNARCALQLGSINSGIGSSYIITGGYLSPGGLSTYQSETAENKSPIEVWRFATHPTVNISGMSDGGFGGKFLTEYDYLSGILIHDIGRQGPASSGGSYHAANGPARFRGRFFEDSILDNTYQQVFDATRDVYGWAGGAGILVDPGSGVLTGGATFARSGTTATFTRAAHKLEVGDYIRPHTYTALGGGAGALGFTSDGAGTTAFYNGNLRVMTVPTADTFTCTVTATGPTSGTVRLFVTRMFRLHDVLTGEHRFQMPQVLGHPFVSGKPAFSWFDKQMRRLMSILVQSENTATLWIKNALAIGGTPGTPDVVVYGGATAPTASHPDGSLYLRTNGTIWQRRSGVWVQLSA